MEKLHPAAQVAAIIAIGVFACIAVYQYFKFLRDD